MGELHRQFQPGKIEYVHRMRYYAHEGTKSMSVTVENRKNKHFLLNQNRLKEAQKVLGAKTETETIELALERVVSEAERNARAQQAQDKFLKTAVRDNLQIEDAFGRLEEIEER